MQFISLCFSLFSVSLSLCLSLFYSKAHLHVVQRRAKHVRDRGEGHHSCLFVKERERKREKVSMPGRSDRCSSLFLSFIPETNFKKLTPASWPVRLARQAEQRSQQPRQSVGRVEAREPRRHRQRAKLEDFPADRDGSGEEVAATRVGRRYVNVDVVGGCDRGAAGLDLHGAVS